MTFTVTNMKQAPLEPAVSEHKGDQRGDLQKAGNQLCAVLLGGSFRDSSFSLKVWYLEIDAIPAT